MKDACKGARTQHYLVLSTAHKAFLCHVKVPFLQCMLSQSPPKPAQSQPSDLLLPNGLHTATGSH